MKITEFNFEEDYISIITESFQDGRIFINKNNMTINIGILTALFNEDVDDIYIKDNKLELAYYGRKTDTKYGIRTLHLGDFEEPMREQAIKFINKARELISCRKSGI